MLQKIALDKTAGPADKQQKKQQALDFRNQLQEKYANRLIKALEKSGFKAELKVNDKMGGWKKDPGFRIQASKTSAYKVGKNANLKMTVGYDVYVLADEPESVSVPTVVSAALVGKGLGTHGYISFLVGKHPEDRLTFRKGDAIDESLTFVEKLLGDLGGTEGDTISRAVDRYNTTVDQKIAELQAQKVVKA